MLCPASINSNITTPPIRGRASRQPGYLVDDLAVKTLQTIYESGMDPEDLARWVRRASRTSNS